MESLLNLESNLQDKFNNSIFALAGLVQAVSLVKDLAETGKIDEVIFQNTIHSIFQTDAPDVPSVYGGNENIRYGLKKLINILTAPKPLIQTRYMLAIMRLQKKITRSPQISTLIMNRVLQTKKQVNYFHLTHPTVIANLADLYLSSIRSLKFKVIIWGSQKVLSVPENMEKIRSLLLAALRSSVLWRQMGGSRLQLLFIRKKMIRTAENLLADIEITLKLKQENERKNV